MSRTFKKEERLCSFNEINDLLRRGKSFFTDPFRVVFVKMEGDRQDKILISIPKRNFKRAVDRNLLKRRIREAQSALNEAQAMDQVQASLDEIQSITNDNRNIYGISSV